MKVLITGDSKGLGNFLCQKLHGNGCEVIGCSRTLPSNCTWEHINLDLSNLDLTLVKKHLKDVDVLINNAGVASSNLAVIEKQKNVKNVFNVNTVAPIVLTNAWALERVRAKKPGKVFFMSSISSYTGVKGLSSYGASKSALNSYSKTFALEMGKFNISSNSFILGYMDTDMSSGLNEKMKQKIKNKIPLGRFLKFDDVYNVLEYYMSEKCTFTTGTDIIIDGGFTI